MRQLPLVAVLTTLLAQAVFAQNAKPTWTQTIAPTVTQKAAPTRFVSPFCRSARSAFARLTCADPDLAAEDSLMNTVFQDAKDAAPPEVQNSLLQEQLTWTQERDQKCGLIGKDHKSIRELLPSKQCLEDSIKARISDLQDASETGSTSQTAASNTSPITITPLVEPSVLIAAAGSATGALPTFQQLHFSASAEAINGTIRCSISASRQDGDPLANTPLSGKWIIQIAVDDDANSYRMFENDAWAPFLDNLRNAVYSACANALKSGRLRNASNEPINELHDAFEVYSPQGLFTAYSVGQNTPWVLQKNLPKARKDVRAELGIETWVDPARLARNPYFFKGSLVGMVIKFDHMLSEKEAVFTRAGAEIFVSNVPPTLFHNDELVVLAGRVMGNRGVVSPSGSEALMPVLHYVGAKKCDNACEGLALDTQ